MILLVIISLILTFLFMLLDLIFIKKKRKPKQYQRIERKVIIQHSGDNIRDGYSKKKIPENLDAIVIGSGIGGLTTAGLLSKVGKKVLVLEQHYIAGGCTHAFEDHGYEFDTGIHYVGNIEKRKKILDLISDEEIKWDKMGREDGKFIYDEIKIGDKEYNLQAGEENFIKEFTTKFPKEKDNIIKYINLVKKVAKKDFFFLSKIAKPRWLVKLISPFINKNFFEMTQKTVLEVMNEITNNQDLIAALCGQFGDSGPTPSKCSFFMHASVVNHYLEGGWYPNGGTSEIARKIIPTIEKAGGRVLVRKAVEKIIIKNNKAIGVKMVNGDEIFAKQIISSAGINNTYKKLLDKKYVPDKIHKLIDSIGLSCSMVYLFVGMEGTPTELKLRSANIWSYPISDYDKMLEDFYKDPENAPIPLFIGFPCAKDSSWESRYPNKSNAVILTMSEYDLFKKWDKNQNFGKKPKREEEYDKLKKIFQKRILEEGLYKYYPQTKGKVKFTSIGSPLTFNYYIGSTKGEVYGADMNPNRFQKDDLLRPKTDINGLYLTGQDITTLGFTGAMMAGILTASEVLGYGNIIDIMSGRNVIEDLLYIENKNIVKKKKLVNKKIA
jgi:all-trans-retinol 13,14-reductase